MEQRKFRAAIVGASSLLGRELAEQLANESFAVWDLTLLDDEDAAGQMTAAGDEAMVIQPMGPGAFNDADAVFFASTADAARTHSKEALSSGATVIDLTGALESASDVRVGSPWVEGAAAPDLTTAAVAPAHPAALMLALIGTRLSLRFGAVKMVATVLQPASQQGKDGLDELHAQTASLLSFQAVPREQYDAQVAFNTLVTLGAEAKASLEEDADRIRRHFAALTGDAALELQLVQAPVFHGYTASIYAELPQAVAAEDVREALRGGMLGVSVASGELPSNLSAMEHTEMQVCVREDNGAAVKQGFWLWAAADNLRVAAQNAVACTAELMRLRPAGKVQ